MPNRKTVGGLGAIQRPAVERFPPIFCTAAYPASIAASLAIPAVVAALAVAIPAGAGLNLIIRTRFQIVQKKTDCTFISVNDPFNFLSKIGMPRI